MGDETPHSLVKYSIAEKLDPRKRSAVINQRRGSHESTEQNERFMDY